MEGSENEPSRTESCFNREKDYPGCIDSNQMKEKRKLPSKNKYEYFKSLSL